MADKIRLTLTAVLEYEPRPSNYPEGQRGIAQMADIDADQYRDMPVEFVEVADSVKVRWEIV